MEIESVEWSTYRMPPEELIEYWAVAADILAIAQAHIKVEAADRETMERLGLEETLSKDR